MFFVVSRQTTQLKVHSLVVEGLGLITFTAVGPGFNLWSGN